MHRAGRAAAILFGCAALAGTQLATGASSQYVERLPRVKPGKLLPSAGGLVLGRTTVPQLLAQWGPATQCIRIGIQSCSWIVGIARNGSMRRGETADYITVVFDQRTRWANSVTLRTTSAQKSRLRGWKMPEGIGIGSAFQAVKRAYPKLRWLRSGAVNMSTWGVNSYEHAGGHYLLNVTFNAATRRVSSGRVVSFDLVWQLPRLTCTLAAEPAAAPEGAAAGRRVRGSCAGAKIHTQVWGRPVPLPVRLVGTRGGQVISASSPFDPNCSDDSCNARPADWAIDITVGLSAANVRLEAEVGPPASSSQVLRIPLG